MIEVHVVPQPRLSSYRLGRTPVSFFIFLRLHKQSLVLEDLGHPRVDNDNGAHDYEASLML